MARAFPRAAASSVCGAVAEWSKALAWKVSIRQNRIEGSNPSRSANFSLRINEMGLNRPQNPQYPRHFAKATEPQRLPELAKSVSDRLLSLFTRTSLKKVRIQNVAAFQLVDGLALV